MKIPCAEVKIGKRHRKEMGDLDALAKSIETVGLLQPIGVTQERRLVFGERRLRAVRKILKQDTIDARVIKIESIADGEYAENEIREDFRPSERVAIARTIQAEMGERRGRPSKKAENFPEIKGKETRDVAAERGGFGNATTYRQATKVVDEGAPGLIDAMDAGTVSVSDAAAATKLSKVEQKGAVQLVEKGEAKTLKQAVKAAKKKAKTAAETKAAKKANKDPDQIRWMTAAVDQLPSKLAPDSIDVIITDPPYDKSIIELCGHLSEAAAVLLRPGGSCFVMVGQSYLPDVMAALGAALVYNWTIAYLTPGGQSAQLWNRKVNTFWKPVLWYSRGKYDGEWKGDVCKSDVNDNDKRFHKWGQSVSGMIALIERCSNAGDVVLDPFCGAGTTGIACLALGRRFIGSDVDSKIIKKAKARLS